MSVEIVPANEDLVSEIEQWLDAEEAEHDRQYREYEAAGYEGDVCVRGFRCNWDSVKQGWLDGRSTLDVLVKDSRAIGFLDGYDILEIHPAERGKGYGRVLAEFMVNRAWSEGRSVVKIEIAPRSALPFWEAMGFTAVHGRRGNGGGIYAYKVMPRPLSGPDGQELSYVVEFFTPEDKYAGRPPFVRYEGAGTLTGDGTVRLTERAICFEPSCLDTYDCFAKVRLNDEVVFFDKVKREEASKLGFVQDEGYIYYIEKITLPDI
ncbi:GNAT family N-acetyltransferase [Paenirhodobacter populi]|uniref:GNAT family N-acetyltransferase n=1 Tax=Paenirhodobacter populi TaxID=2306993 RepID=A0A443J082_9RHOB|nr:GNAT family N-acetyltransferase [Sinirhodobacter populi]RWR13837.1 GNAT family N-acetyltransferase [Sinirhodobacter populi]